MCLFPATSYDCTSTFQLKSEFHYHRFFRNNFTWNYSGRIAVNVINFLIGKTQSSHISFITLYKTMGMERWVLFAHILIKIYIQQCFPTNKMYDHLPLYIKTWNEILCKLYIKLCIFRAALMLMRNSWKKILLTYQENLRPTAATQLICGFEEIELASIVLKFIVAK